MEYLYHYTNIEALALILKNRSIRFSPLNKLDDLQEQETADIKNLGKFFYVSSWTEDATESIPMWNMYASLERGVRIKLCKDPFKLYDNSFEEISKVIQAEISGNPSKKTFQTLIPLSEMLSKGFTSIQAMNKQLLYPVEYTNDLEKLYPRILTKEENGYSLFTGVMGKYKNLHWSFQKEWRYILNCVPMDLNQSPDKAYGDFQRLFAKMVMGIEHQPFPYYDLIIADEAFSSMEITPSPRFSAGCQVILQSLVKEYNPTAAIIDSELNGLI